MIRITNYIPMKIINGVSFVTEFTDKYGKIYIQNFTISTYYIPIYLRKYDNIHSAYNFVNFYNAFIIIPKYLLVNKLKNTKNIQVIENLNNFVLIHKNYFYKDLVKNIFNKNQEFIY